MELRRARGLCRLKVNNCHVNDTVKVKAMSVYLTRIAPVYTSEVLVIFLLLISG